MKFPINPTPRARPGIARLGIASFATAAIIVGGAGAAYAAPAAEISPAAETTQTASEVATGSGKLSTGSSNLLQAFACLFGHGFFCGPLFPGGTVGNDIG